MKIATINQIVEDSKDGKYGNNNDYEYVANKANMGYKDTLELFLKYVKNNYNNHSEKFLDLWDHGAGSTFIVGGDDNYGGNEDSLISALTNKDLDSVFKEIDIKYNLIGFDTCLNGSLEVARSMAPYSEYMLASEETEPGHGWNYTHLISKYAVSTDFKTLGTELVDSFVDTDSHYVIEDDIKYSFSKESSSGKTLSLVDLSKFNSLLTEVNKLGDALVKINEDRGLKDSVITSITKARGYNLGKEDNTKKAQVDLRHFSVLLKKTLDKNGNGDHNVYTLANNVISAIDSYVVYSKDDGSRSNSSGVAVFGLNDEGTMYSWLGTEGSKLSDNWYNAVQAYQALGKTDTQKPKVEEEKATTTISTNEWENYVRQECALYLEIEDNQKLAESYYAQCLADYGIVGETSAKLRRNGTSIFLGEEGAFINKNSKSKLRNTEATINVTTATFSDDNLKQVRTVYGNMVDGSFLTTAIIQAKPLNKKDGIKQTYFTPIWNQNWYTMMPSSTSTQSEWMPFVFRERRSNGEVVYDVEIDYVDTKGDYSGYAEGEKFDYARLEVVVDNNNKLVSNIVKPYTIIKSEDGSETIHFGKTKGSLEIGDKIIFYSQNFDMNTSKIFFNQESDEIILQQKFNLNIEELEFGDEEGNPLDYYYMMVGEDINNNRAFSSLQKAQKDTN